MSEVVWEPLTRLNACVLSECWVGGFFIGLSIGMACATFFVLLLDSERPPS